MCPYSRSLPDHLRTRKLYYSCTELLNDMRVSCCYAVQIIFMGVEILVGLWTNSLGLISDAGHMFFDNASLMIGLYASYMSKWRRDEEYTYGCVMIREALYPYLLRHTPSHTCPDQVSCVYVRVCLRVIVLLLSARPI